MRWNPECPASTLARRVAPEPEDAGEQRRRHAGASDDEPATIGVTIVLRNTRVRIRISRDVIGRSVGAARIGLPGRLRVGRTAGATTVPNGFRPVTWRRPRAEGRAPD